MKIHVNTLKQGASNPSVDHSYSIYAIGLLVLVNVVNYMDRVILSLLLPDIQADLELSDSQLGWLTGMAFALFYACFGIPLARLADVWVRKYLIIIALTSWSFMTMASGIVNNFIQMLLVRIGVGIGEAGCIPASHSLISDLVKPSERSNALAVYTAGATIGIILGLSAGGWLNEIVGWRWTFVIIGAPGVLLAILLVFTFSEPIRGQFDAVYTREAKPSFVHSAKELFASSTYRYIVIAYSAATFSIYGLLQWLPSYYTRTFELSSTAIGTFFGITLGVGLTVGVLVGGAMGNYLMKRNQRWGLWMPAISMASSIPFVFLLLSSKDFYSAAGANFAFFALSGMISGPLFAVIQGISLPDTRATATAMLMFVASILGIGGGPLAVGVISDSYTGLGSVNPLGEALYITAYVPVLSVITLVLGGFTLPTEQPESSLHHVKE